MLYLFFHTFILQQNTSVVFNDFARVFLRGAIAFSQQPLSKARNRQVIPKIMLFVRIACNQLSIIVKLAYKTETAKRGRQKVEKRRNRINRVLIIAIVSVLAIALSGCSKPTSAPTLDDIRTRDTEPPTPRNPNVRDTEATTLSTPEITNTEGVISTPESKTVETYLRDFIETEIRYVDGNFTWRIEYTYDTLGNTLTYTHYHRDNGNMDERWEYTYDSQGKKLYTTKYFDERVWGGENEYTWVGEEYTYDSQGYLSSEQLYDYDGGIGPSV